MPHTLAPTYYELADYIAPGNADDFFKWLDDDEFVSTTGSVEAPVGWVGLLKCTSDMIATYVSTFGDPWMSEKRNFDEGWYIVRRDENGFVWGMCYGSLEHTLPEENARADYAQAEYLWQVWDCQIEGMV